MSKALSHKKIAGLGRRMGEHISPSRRRKVVIFEPDCVEPR